MCVLQQTHVLTDCGNTCETSISIITMTALTSLHKMTNARFTLTLNHDYRKRIVV